MKTVILERNSLGTDINMKIFEDFGEVVEYPVTLYNQASERIGDAECIIVNKIPINKEVLDGCPNVKLILESATGVDNIDLKYCESRGITVTNVKGYSTQAVAQHTFAMFFYLMEHLRFYDDYVKSGEYGSQPKFSYYGRPFYELEGKTWGIIGLGEIGRRVASIATAYGCRVMYYSASGNTYDVPYENVDFDKLLRESDVVSIHAPLNDNTRGLIDSCALGKMKKTAYLINVGRGPIINDADLAEAIRSGQIAGACLDVLGKEPISKDNPLGDIKDSDRLIITPHMAWAATESRQRLVNEMYYNAKAFLAGESRGIVKP